MRGEAPRTVFLPDNDNVQGGTSDYLCLPDIPQYSTYRPGVQGYSPIYGAEYEIEHDTLPLPGVRDDNVPCALCRNSQRFLSFLPACLVLVHGQGSTLGTL